ncbi:MAG: DUF6177 family protein [Arachnia propionica]|uniref:DUF6177 family protein n=1 Tax=Arachnia propionica TaxID=1750 RepID=UPI00270F61F1|nr:DUF6177 family protein [Arachnia propionica]
MHSDGWAEGIRFFDSAASHVVLTSSLQAFLSEAWTTRSRPQLRTNHDAHLSWFVSDEMRRLDGQWLVLGPDGVDYDAHTGLPIEAPPGSRAARLPINTTNPPSHLALTFDVLTREPATWATTCGRVAEFMTSGLGGGQLTVVDTAEPLGQRWSTADLTARLRTEMPVSHRHLARSSTGAVATIQVKRTDHGITENSRGVVPVPQWTRITPELTRLVDDVLTELAATFRLTMASIALARVEMSDGRLGHHARPHPADLPVALLIGPAQLRDLGLDAEVSRRRFNATTIGSSKAPALLVPLSDAPNPHRQMQEFLSTIDQEALQTMLSEALTWLSPTRKR